MLDTYYQTRVNTRWGRSAAGSILGLTLVFLGICALIFTSVDISVKSIAGRNPMKELIINRSTKFLGTIESDYSIWPTLGKGIWVGLFLMATGIIAICSQRERTSKAIAATTILAALSALFSFYMMGSAILQVEPYLIEGSHLKSFENRSDAQNTELAMNSLLIAMGALGFIVSSILACLGCLSDSCTNYNRYGGRGPMAPGSFAPTVGYRTAPRRPYPYTNPPSTYMPRRPR